LNFLVVVQNVGILFKIVLQLSLHLKVEIESVQ
jgi:hypothetical protein